MAPTWPVSLCRVADHLPGALEPSETWPLHSHPVGHSSGVHLWNACMHATRASLEDCRGQLAPLPPAPWWCQVEGATGSVRVPPGPSRATGPAPACLAVCQGGLRWATWVSWWLSEGWPEHAAWLPAAPWLPDPAPLGCAQQIPSSWDLPAISLSEDGVLGRGVCVRAERVQREAAYPGFCPCLLLGAGGGTAHPLPSQTQPRRPRVTEPGAGEACPKTGGRGPYWGSPCLAVCQLLSASHRRSPCLAGLRQPQSSECGGLGLFWPRFLVLCSCVALDKFLSPPGVRLPTCKVG